MSLNKPNNHADLMGSVSAAKTTGELRQITANAILAFARKEISSSEMNDATKRTKEVIKKLNSSLKRNPTRIRSNHESHQ